MSRSVKNRLKVSGGETEGGGLVHFVTSVLKIIWRWAVGTAMATQNDYSIMQWHPKTAQIHIAFPDWVTTLVTTVLFSRLLRSLTKVHWCLLST